MSGAQIPDPEDSWDQPSSNPSWPSPNTKETARAVPDDWDDDDEEEIEDNQQVWDDANKKPPMPELVHAASSTSNFAAPPAAAFQPAIRILKRPSGTPGPTFSSNQEPSPQSFAMKEASYQAARERIFNEEGEPRTPGVNLGSKSGPEPEKVPRAGKLSQSPSSAVIRNPRGPKDFGESVPAKGFDSKRKREPTSENV